MAGRARGSGAENAIFHYQGTDWIATGSGTNDVSTIFQAVWGSAADDVWAVGYRGFAGSPAKGVIAHWDGQRWSLSPDSPAQTLYAIWGSGPDDVWVAGAGVILHYQADAWSSVAAADIH